jgi:hypothetical protein
MMALRIQLKLHSRTTVEGGTVFRVVRYQPGVAARNHRTDSIDYAAVVIAGAIERWSLMMVSS